MKETRKNQLWHNGYVTAQAGGKIDECLGLNNEEIDIWSSGYGKFKSMEKSEQNNQDIQCELDIAVKALMDIIEHVEFVAGSMSQYSSVTAIAKKALNEINVKK